MKFNETLEKCLSQSVTEEENKEVLEKFNIPKKDRTYKSLVACKLVDLAVEGDYKAVNLVTNLVLDAEREEERRNDPLNIF
jgi:hypothetical protein